MIWQWDIKLSDEASEVLRGVLSRQTFAEFVNGAINQAAPYGDPNDNSDIEIALARIKAQNKLGD